MATGGVALGGQGAGQGGGQAGGQAGATAAARQRVSVPPSVSGGRGFFSRMQVKYSILYSIPRTRGSLWFNAPMQ